MHAKPNRKVDEPGPEKGSGFIYFVRYCAGCVSYFLRHPKEAQHRSFINAESIVREETRLRSHGGNDFLCFLFLTPFPPWNGVPVFLPKDRSNGFLSCQAVIKQNITLSSIIR